MPRHHKVEELLTRDELDAFEKFCNEPARTIDEAHEWLQAHGYTIGRTAVGNWLREFRERAMHDRVRQSIESSERFVAVAKEAGVAGMAEASLARFQQLMFETLVRMDDVEPGELLKLSAALKTAVEGGRHIEKLREEVTTRQRTAIEAAEATAKNGGNADAAIAKMREILGIKEAA